MAELHIGFVMGRGYFVYGDDASKQIGRDMEESDAIAFGKKLAKATFATFDETVQYFDPLEIKKVLSSEESKQLDQIKLQKDIMMSHGDEFLENYRNGLPTDKEPSSNQTICYTNGIDWE